MKANTVFVHDQNSRAALQAGAHEFFAIQTRRRHDVALDDEVTGDLLRNHVKWFFNVTRGTLITIKVLGSYASLRAAIAAIRSMAPERVPAADRSCARDRGPPSRARPPC